MVTLEVGILDPRRRVLAHTRQTQTLNLKTKGTQGSLRLQTNRGSQGSGRIRIGARQEDPGFGTVGSAEDRVRSGKRRTAGSRGGLRSARDRGRARSGDSRVAGFGTAGSAEDRGGQGVKTAGRQALAQQGVLKTG